jgi:ribonuclease P protein component
LKIEDSRFRKSERLVSQKQIDRLFATDGSHSKAAFPVRAVFCTSESIAGQQPVQIMVSVPKRRFKHAVDRNRVKRQIREAYRKNKQLLVVDVPQDKHVDIAFLWLSDKIVSSRIVEERMKTLLTSIAHTVKSL